MTNLKRHITIVFFLAVASFAWSGSFYTSIIVVQADPKAVINFIKTQSLKAFIVFSHSDVPTDVLVCEKGMEGQDEAYGKALAERLSKSLSGVTVYSLNHDSDILVIAIFSAGTQVFSYDSAPGYFDGKDDPPFMKGIENVSTVFPSAAISDLDKALKGEFIFADDRHAEIMKALGLPTYTAGLGYGYLNEPETRKTLENNKLSWIETK